ncbi:zinc ribbon domain-containing protein [Roseibium sp.]|uniref:zinc ribbon domain-containing protein n=1 Tax=Roseibium sp. TaxID=1936156 RepID=UPI00391CC3B5
MIADNATGKFGPARGAVRRGEALLAGLLRCGHCGRKLHVAYSGKAGTPVATIVVAARSITEEHAASRSAVCAWMGGQHGDYHAAATLGYRGGSPSRCGARRGPCREAASNELSLEQARYEASRARRQYDSVDPDNRLVAGELEARWNARLGDVAALEDQIKLHDATAASHSACADNRAQLMSLGADIERAWGCPGTTPATKKQIIRTLVEEIVVSVDGETIELIIHWQGGAHSALAVRKNRCGQHRWKTDNDVVDLTRALARLMPDKLIAAALNRAGKVTGRGNGWTQSRVCTLRNYHQIVLPR